MGIKGVKNIRHYRALMRGRDMYYEHTRNRRTMIAQHIAARQPVPYDKANKDIRAEIAEIFGVSLRTVEGVWIDVMRYRCSCCGHIKLPPDYEVDYA